MYRYVAPEILAEIGMSDPWLTGIDWKASFVLGYGVEVDCWATGIILYILLCGYPPFKATDRSQEELFQLIQRGKFIYEPEYWSSISSSTFFCRCIESDARLLFVSLQMPKT